MFRQVFLEEVQQASYKSSKFWSCFLFVTIFLFSVPLLTQAQDPGIPDTVRIEADSLIVGQSRPITLTIVNDEDITTYSTGLVFTELNGGFARFDSVVFVNRMSDPSVLNVRFVVPRGSDGISPDSLILASYQVVSNLLGPGNTAVCEIYMTGLSVGELKVDSSFIPPGSIFIFIMFGGQNFTPQFVTQTIPIVEGTAPPTVTIDNSTFRNGAGERFIFEAGVSSPEGFPVSASLTSFSKFDDASSLSTNAPSFSYNSGSGLYDFSWSSTSSDIGIWRAVISACDSVGSCISVEVIIQVVANANYLIDLQVTESSGFNFPTAVGFGNFDNDLEPEIVS
ncbi:MAG: hypothetical protein IH931_05445, partial [candidate division Zixibacteria bacterium]|nr:hypothetical protein [candidate division Zixibacteria bacterium]